MGDIRFPGLKITSRYKPYGETNPKNGIEYYNKKATEKNKPISALVIHHTSGGSMEGAISWSFGGSSNERGFHTGYHFIVDKDGSIAQVAPENARTYHTQSYAGPPFNNEQSIGISFVGSGIPEPQGEMREAGIKLIAGLMKKYNLTPNQVKGHAETAKPGVKAAHEGMWIHNAIKNGELDQYTKGLDNYQYHGSGYFNRGRFAKQIADDSKLKQELINLTYAEVGGINIDAQTAFIETVFNRANAHGTNNIKDMLIPGYYQPMKDTAKYNMKKEVLRKNPQYKKNIEKALENALSGSNVSNFSTHNASGETAKEAEKLGDVRLNIKYTTTGGTPSQNLKAGDSDVETFYTKTKDTTEARAKHYDLIDKEKAWLNSVGGGGSGATPGSFRGAGTGTGTGAVLGEGGLLGGLFSSGGLFGSQGGLGALAGSLIGSGAIPTSSISSAISSSLPSSLASLPSASTISSGLAQSIQSGQGFTPFTSAVQSIASADTPVGRLSAIGDVATEYEAEIKALVPSLSDMDFKSIIPAIVGLEDQGPNQRLVSALKMMESVDPDKLMTVGDVLKGDPLETMKEFLGIETLENQPLSTIFDKENLPEEAQAILFGKSLFTKIDKAIETEDLQGIYVKALYGNKEEQAKALEFLTKGNLPDIEGLEESFPTLLSGTLEEIVKTPLVTSQLGEQYAGIASTVLTGEASVVEQTLTDLGASELAKATGISGDTSKTLLAGGTEEEIKKMRNEIGGIALDGFIESNPTLKGIIDWFYNNQNLITLLGSAGAFAGLSSLLGGGIGGGFAAGAGGLIATRLLLGEEGFNQFQGAIKSAAAPVFDMAQKALIDSGLAEVPIIGSLLQNILSVGSNNPLAATALLTGNMGMAAGLIGGSMGINADVLSSLTGGDQTTQIQENIAGYNQATQNPMSTDSDTDGRHPTNDPAAAGGTQKGMFLPTSPVGYNDWGTTGIQGAVGGNT